MNDKNDMSSQQIWRPIETAPIDAGLFLVYDTIKQNYAIGARGGDGISVNIENLSVLNNGTFWMPLPEPPELDEDN